MVMRKSTQLSFDDLKRDVINKGLCTKGGACVAYCTSEQMGAIEMCGCTDNLPRYVDPDKCLMCGICYLICPQTVDLNEKVKEKFGWSHPIGIYRDIFSAQAKDKEIRDVATDGGVVTALLSFMLDNKIIDGALVANRTGLLTQKPEIVTTREKLIEITGSQFPGFRHPEEMSKIHSNYVSMLPIVKMFGSKPSLRLAVVGTPCQITAIRKMQVLNILPSNTIYFTIGLFCMYSYSFDNLMEKTFIKKYNINPHEIQKINIKENLQIVMKSSQTIQVPFNDIEDIARPSCLECENFINNFADISVGGIGSSDRYTTTMIRTIRGKRIFNDAVRQNYIKEPVINKNNKSKILEHINNIIAKKINRAQKNKAVHQSDICEKLNQHLRWVLSFVSHELSSTLGTSIMNISALADEEISSRLDKETHKKMMRGALSNLKLMQDMILNYLMSSKVKKGLLAFTPSRLNLKMEIIDQVISRLDPIFKKNSISLVWDKYDNIELHCDKSLIRVAINNLINNAIKYGTANTSIRASLEKWEDGFMFTITNEGIGIPEEKTEEVFEEYKRFDQLGVSGTGLGLHVVKIVSAIHNGKIAANAGYILDEDYVSYKMLKKYPDRYNIDPDTKDLRKFATFILCIPDSSWTESSSELDDKI